MQDPSTSSPQLIALPPGKKIYFASDFHLGSPDAATSREREKKIVRWLDQVSPDAAAVFLVGDIFDFWFEYRHAIPKGFIRLQGQLARMRDAGIPVIFFTGNHDMWMFDYFTQEMDIPVYHQPQEFLMGGASFLVGHGDGLGPGDHSFKLLKKIFRSRMCQWLFARIHPDTGIGIANFWSRRSRSHKIEIQDEPFLGEREWILMYCKQVEQKRHHDYYVFGHRHLPLDLPVSDTSRYVNLGEWFSQYTFASFDGINLILEAYE